MTSSLDLENAARGSLVKYLGKDEPLATLYLQPDRALFRTELSNLVLKVYVDGKTLEREYEVIKKAKSADVPIPEIIGLDINTFTVLTMRYVPGVPLNGTYKNATKEAGKFLQRFHNIKAHPPFSGGQQNWNKFISWWSQKEIDSLKRLGLCSNNELASLREIFHKFQSAIKHRPVVLLHGDLQVNHVIIDPEKDIVKAFIDFADAQPGDPLLDIAVLTLWNHELIPLLLEGYESIKDNEETQSLISHYRLLRHLAEIPWLYSRGYKELANKNILRVKEAIIS